jgi:enoyl-CoA hydratase/carnithine racemase
VQNGSETTARPSHNYIVFITENNMVQTSQVIVETLDAKQGKIGILTLNAEKTLNSLTLEMVGALTTTLAMWAEDESIAIIVLKGAGDKAFCAGGDVQKLYESSISETSGPRKYAEQFFCEEYQLNYLIHTYTKPILCLATGIVMGGGLGLMAGASHRVTNERTRIAMPEITIGLFPDVGGTWFLNKMPYALGIFFALTGASVNAPDALITGLADFFLDTKTIAKLEDTLIRETWSVDSRENHRLLSSLLHKNNETDQATHNHVTSELKPYLAEISKACHETSLGEVITALQHLQIDSEWFKRSIKTLMIGSPLSSVLIFEQLRRHRHSALTTVFESELQLATNIVRHTEFAEGVRALLIDKDKQPKWQHQHFSEVSNTLLESFFRAPWEGGAEANPLRLS